MDLDSALALVNGRVRALDAYHLAPHDVEVKLNQNENPFDWPGEIKETVASFVKKRQWNRYPDFIPSGLKEALAGYAGVAPANIIAGNGSNEMLLLILLSLTSDDRPLLTCQPTFTVYRLLASGLGRDEEPVYLTPELRFDIDAICAASKKRPRAVLMLCSPNNPTGTALSHEQIRRVLDIHEGFVILDQAYVEFGGYDATGLVAQHPNLIVTRTFSKAFGAAGLRLGYLVGNAGIVRELNKIKLPYNINFFSEYVGRMLLGRPDIVARTVEHIAGERARVAAFLTTVPNMTTYDSSANFILIRVDGKDQLFDFLTTRGILVRDVSSYPMLDNCLRMSLGTSAENDRFITAVSEYYHVAA